MFKRLLFAITLISIATAIGIAGYLYFAKQRPALAQIVGENIYISQSGNGSQDGSDCNNAHPVSWFNTVGNWANPKQAGKIGPGDTAHLCGTIPISLTIQGSGSIGAPITILFENGAKLSASFWSSGAIIGSGNDYIIVDGGINGVIEAVNNGTSLINQMQSYGVYIGSNAINWEIKNLTISNMYARTPDSSDSSSYGYAITIKNSNNIFIHDNILTDGFFGVYAHTVSAGSFSNINIYNNRISNMATGIVVALGANSSSLDSVNIYNNIITGGNVWDGCWSNCSIWHHVDGIHTWTRSTNTIDRITNLKIYGNIIGPDMGAHATSFIYTADMTLAPLIYNNVLYNTTE